MKKILSAILLIAMLCQFTSCGNSAEETNSETVGTEPAADETTIAAEPTAGEKRAAVLDDLPNDLDFGNADVNLLVRDISPFNYEMGVDSLNGEVVNDAIYERNRTVEERLKVNINITVTGDYHDTETISKAVMSGDDVYTIAFGSYFIYPNVALNGYFNNLHKINYLDFDKPWWVQNLRDEMTINGNLFVMSGDIALSLYQYEKVMYVNRSLAADYGFTDDLYDIVMDGKWTLDKVYELSSNVSFDIDGNGILDEKDRFGLGVMDSTDIYALGCAAGMKVTEKDSSGIPVLVMDSAHTFDIFDKVNKMLRDNTTTITPYNGAYKTSTENDNIAVLQKMFVNDQVLVYTGNLLDAEEFRNMDSDFDIVPMPKYDENQESYTTISRDTYTIAVIPKTVLNTDMAGAVCEAMAAESYRNVTPAYLDIALKDKYSRDSRTGEMVNIVISSISFDFGLCYSHTMDYVSHAFQNAIENNQGFASRYELKKRSAEKGLEKIINYYNSLEN